MKKPSKTIERELYIEVKDNAEGRAMILELAELLMSFRHNRTYLNGWIGPVKGK
jgi:hypothetical protein